MPKISVNKLSIYYEKHGRGEPLVLIAGFSADHNVWQPVLALFKKHYEVIIFDNRGAGQTDIPKGPYSIEMLADDVIGLCDALNIKSAHFVGSSMGGMMVQSLAYRYPDRLKSIVISNAALNTTSPFQIYLQAKLYMLQSQFSLEYRVKADASWLFSNDYLTHENHLENLIQIYKDNSHSFTAIGCEAQLAARNRFDSSQWVSKIQSPTLVIGSDQDLIANEESVKAVAEAIPSARYYSFNNCGHLPHIEYPDKFFNLVHEFIQSI